MNVWNCLSPEMIDFSSLASFRRSLEATDIGALTLGLLIRSLSQFVFVLCFRFLVNFCFLCFRFYSCLKAAHTLPCSLAGVLVLLCTLYVSSRRINTVRYDNFDSVV